MPVTSRRANVEIPPGEYENTVSAVPAEISAIVNEVSIVRAFCYRIVVSCQDVPMRVIAVEYKIGRIL
jgi:hypothetical protein